jgi:3D-(3,5/4)-trihydroxycyclohexane-1,2-dione acylhydrolase (decyclizing)
MLEMVETDTTIAKSDSRHINLTGAQALIYYLTRQKVELFDGSLAPLFGGIFGIYGHGNVAGIGEAIAEYKTKMPFYRGQNEQGMAHAAIAYAKANRCRRVMAVTSSIGPGATNMVTAAALAHTNRLPVLFLPGDIYASRRPDPVLQQLEDERSGVNSVNDCFIPVSRYYDKIMRPEQLMKALPQAIQTLMNPLTRGPVTLSFPQDTQAEVYRYPVSFFQENIHYIERLRPDQRQLQRAVYLIRSAKRPLILIGGGVVYSNAEEAVRIFAEKHGIPFAETQAGKGALPGDHPWNLGAIGVTGTACANEIARESDLIICIGTRLSDFTTASKSLFHRAETAMINININPYDAGKGAVEAVVGDALEAVLELNKLLDDYRTEEAYSYKISQVKTAWSENRASITAVGSSQNKPADAQVVAAVNRQSQEKDIIVCAAGGLPGELHKLWQSKSGQGYHVEYAYSCMGYEIAGGLGVKMAKPDSEVYVMVGDGSYLMLHTELLTSLQLGLKLNIVLLDNRGFGCINRLQKHCGSAPSGNLFSQEGSPQVDFVANAASYGCHAVKVKSIDELEFTLRQNRSLEKTCVTVIETDPEIGSPSNAWWDVAVAGRSHSKDVEKARSHYEEQIKKLSW